MKKKLLLTSLLLLLILSFNISNIFASNKTDIKIEQNGSIIQIEDNLNIKPIPKEVESFQVLPSSYDLRDVNGENYVTPVGFQNPWGVCWAFSALGSAESNILMQHPGAVQSFSVRAFADGAYMLQGKENTPVNQREGIYIEAPQGLNAPALRIGGDERQSIAQMSTWNAASTTEQIPYQNNEGTFVNSPIPGLQMPSPNGIWTIPYSDLFDNEYHLQNSQIYDNEDLNTFNHNVKNAIMNQGGLSLSFNANQEFFNEQTGAWFNPENVSPDHQITVVGWDDNYPVSNFIPEVQPTQPGAWLCKNSWSTEWGLDGYFYLSYYTPSITNAAFYNIESKETGYSYDNIYQHDYSGDRLGLSSEITNSIAVQLYEDGISTDNFAIGNTFTANNNESLKAVSVYTVNSDAEVNIDIYKLNNDYTNPTDGEKITSQTVQISDPGFSTVELNNPVNLTQGGSFGIVESISYNVLLDDTPATIPGLSIEYGTDNAIPVQLSTNDNNSVEADSYINVVVNPGESFIYGLETDNNGNPVWSDISNNQIQNSLTITDSSGTEFTPGNVMIKAYTSDTTNPETTSLTLNPTNLYLTTNSEGTTTQTIQAELSPSSSTEEISWSINPTTVATISGNGSTARVTAVSEGQATITAQLSSGITAKATIIVNNDPMLTDNITIDTSSPDNFSVVVNNLRANPAFNKSNEIENVSIFCWSDPNQEDINAKRASRIPGTDNWQFTGFPVNDNEVHSYFNNASKILINVYASTETNSDGYMIGSGTYDWVNLKSSGNNLIAYISYNQNIGFDKPTVFESNQAGVINDPNVAHIEGIRVSSNMEGLSINSQVHVADLGWLNVQGDGVYNGTMGQDRALEAIRLSLEGPQASIFSFSYRVYIKDIGWSNWVSNGQTAGTTGQARPIQAFEIQISPN